MLKVVWNIIKYFLGLFQRLLYPAKRLICRRRKLSTSDVVELTSIGTGDGFQMSNSVSGSLPQNEADLEMESWDSWGTNSGQQHQQGQQDHNNYYGAANGHQASVRKVSGGPGHNHYTQHHHHQQQQQEPESEDDIDFFEDMTPAVQKQKKFLIRQKELKEQTGISNRLSVMSDVPIQTSELESWEDTGNAWEDNAEATEDMTWQAEEAIREKKKKDRMERQMEQQRKKMRKEETRGMKGGSLVATKLS